MAAASLASLLQSLSEETRALAAPHDRVPRVRGPLSPLEFLRDYVAPNRPCVIEGAIDHWPALSLWTDEYLVEALGEREVHVDFTPDGRGDALARGGGAARLLPREDDSLYQTSHEGSLESSRQSWAADCPEESDKPPKSKHVQASTGEGVAASVCAANSVSIVEGARERSDRATSSPTGALDDGRAREPGEGSDARPAGGHPSQYWFTTPFEARLLFPQFLEVLRDSRKDPSIGVPYVQHQNSSLTTDFSTLAADVADGVPFATSALGSPPEATNFWVGDQRAETAWHKDHYENVYAVVSGEKHFRLMPPCDVPRMRIRDYPCARYWRPKTLSGPLYMVPNDPPRTVPWSSVDASLNLLPGLPSGSAVLPPGSCSPVTCTLGKGDVLYLPAMWFHHVTQTPDESGRTIAVNFWYDMSFDLKYAYYKMVEGLAWGTGHLDSS